MDDLTEIQAVRRGVERQAASDSATLPRVIFEQEQHDVYPMSHWRKTYPDIDTVGHLALQVSSPQ